MSLSVGIVGLPNVGKSTLFNSLLKRQQALAANFPFATIKPNIGIVDVPDIRLDQLYTTVLKEFSGNTSTPGVGKIETKKIPAVIKFVDIAGLAPGAHKGEGLGNKFLSHIRETNIILHLVRAFENENIIRAGSVNPQKDIEILNTELILKDIETVQKMVENQSKRMEVKTEGKILDEILQILNAGKLLYKENLSKEAKELAENVSLLTIKPQIIVFNTDENEVPKIQEHSNSHLYISAKLENELSSLSENDQKEYLKQLGIEKSGLNKVIAKCYELLGYRNFLTAGIKEVRAWQFTSGMTAQECAGVIHTDFEKSFIAVDVVNWKDYVENVGWKNCKDKGLVRLEGREYLMQDGDTVLFRVNTR
ncbi:MAG: redox-regulated ATPase YchF [bacterium]